MEFFVLDWKEEEINEDGFLKRFEAKTYFGHAFAFDFIDFGAKQLGCNIFIKNEETITFIDFRQTIEEAKAFCEGVHWGFYKKGVFK